MGKKEKKTKKMTSSTEKQMVRMSGSSEKQTVRRMGSSENLSKSAQDRILALHMEEDMDRIYSFALQNKLRIIGLRDNSEFHVV